MPGMTRRIGPRQADLEYAMAHPRAQLTSVDPTLRQRMARAMSGDAKPGSIRHYLTERTMGTTGVGDPQQGLVDFTPLGVALQAQEGGRKMSAPGHRVAGGLEAGLAILPLPGAAGGLARGLERAGAKQIQRSVEKDVIGDVALTAAEARPARGIINTPDLRTLDQEQAIAAARPQPHLRTASDGSYVGGPAGVAGPRKLSMTRRRFDADVAAGAQGADWYGRARTFNREVAGPAPARQQLIADEEALWSAQSTPDTNLNFALQGHNAYEVGKPADLVRTGQQATTYRTARDAGERVPLGPKTSIYGQHLDPTAPPATTGTNDIWHARAFGYTGADGESFSRALTAQEHRFLDYETMLAVDRANTSGLGGRTDWTAAEIQAAPWVAGKGRSLAESRGLTPEQGLDEAAKTYPDHADKYTAFATYEATPGAMTGHLPDLVKGNFEERAAFAADPRSRWTDAEGRDAIYDAAGVYQRPTQEATGVYTPPGGEMEINPAFVARPLVGIKDGAVDPASREALDTAEGVRAYIDAQGAGAWHKPIFNAKPAEMGSLYVPQDHPLSLDQIHALQEAGGAHGIGDVVDTGQGATMTNFYPGPPSGAETGKALRTGLAADVHAATGAEPRRAKIDAGYQGYEDAWQAGEGSGAATQQLHEVLSNPHLLEKLDADPAIRAKALANLDRDAELAASTGQPLREDIQRARQIIGEQGFKGLFEALKRGERLPAIALPVGGAAAFGASQQPQESAPGE